MTISHRRLKVKVIGQDQGRGQANAVGPTSIKKFFLVHFSLGQI